MEALTLPDQLDAAVRAALFCSEFAAAGLAWFLLCYGVALRESVPQLLRLGSIAALCSLVLLPLHLLLLPGRMAGDFSGLADREFREMTLHSTTAMSVAVQFGAALLLLAGLRSRRNGTSGIAAAGMAAGALAMAAGFLLTGHTAFAQDWLLSGTLLLHLLVAQFWVGALLALPLLARLERPALSAAVVERFSQRATWLVPLIPLAGVLLALLLLQDSRALLQPYGFMLIAKALLTVLALALAAANRWRLGPALADGSARSRGAFQRSVVVETVVVALVLACAAIMTTWFAPE